MTQLLKRAFNWIEQKCQTPVAPRATSSSISSLNEGDAQSIDRSPMGLVAFCNQSGEVVGRLNNRWTIMEDVTRKIASELPKIRMKVERKDIGKNIECRSSIIIMSKEWPLLKLQELIPAYALFHPTDSIKNTVTSM